MGTYQKGIMGAFSGTIGTVIGGYWREIEYMRSRPTKRNAHLQKSNWISRHALPKW